MEKNQLVTMGELETLYPSAIKSGIPVMMVSSPGLGKTTLFNSTAQKMERDAIIFYPALSDITAIKGFPVMQDGKAEWIPYGDLRRILEATRQTNVLFDDAGQALPSMQGGMMQILQARQIDGRRIPDCVHFSVATNAMSDMSASYGIIDAVKDRCLIFNIIQDWKSSFNWGKRNGFHPLVLGYLAFHMDEIFKNGAPSQELSHHTRTSPRSLERLSNMVYLCQNNSLPGKEVKNLVYASIDPINAESFLKYLQAKIDVDSIFSNPDSSAIIEGYKLLVLVKCMSHEGSGDIQKLRNGFKYLVRTKNHEALAVYLSMISAEEQQAVSTIDPDLVASILS